MKKIILIAAITLGLNIANALTPNPEKYTFKSTSREVNFETERGKGEIIFHFQSANMNDYEQIVVERGGQNGGFVSCRTLNVQEMKVNDGYFVSVDKFPPSAKTDCYYRIKTIAKDGVTRTFPPVKLDALER